MYLGKFIFCKVDFTKKFMKQNLFIILTWFQIWLWILKFSIFVCLFVYLVVCTSRFANFARRKWSNHHLSVFLSFCLSVFLSFCISVSLSSAFAHWPYIKNCLLCSYFLLCFHLCLCFAEGCKAGLICSHLAVFWILWNLTICSYSYDIVSHYVHIS